MSADPTPEAPAARVVLRVITPNTTPEEIAALLAVLAAKTAGPADTGPARSVVGWNDRAAHLQSLPAPGPGAWRASAWVR